MLSAVQTPPSTPRQLTAQRLIGYALIPVVSLISIVTLHEATHLVVGRLLGVPAVFLNVTSAGVSPDIAAHMPPANLALMNGIAPVSTVIIGVLVLIVLPRLSRSIPNIITRFLAWWAIFGVPYLGLQMMLTGLPTLVRGNGNDFAAVAGYFGLPQWLRALIALLGLLFFCISTFWLRTVIASTDNEPFAPRLRLANLPTVPTRWRRYVAILLAGIFVALALWGTIMIIQARSSGATILATLCAQLIWPIVVALLVPWRNPGSTSARNNWLLPGLVASALLLILGVLTGSDYITIAVMLPSLLVASAWAQAASVPSEWELRVKK